MSDNVPLPPPYGDPTNPYPEQSLYEHILDVHWTGTPPHPAILHWVQVGVMWLALDPTHGLIGQVAFTGTATFTWQPSGPNNSVPGGSLSTSFSYGQPGGVGTTGLAFLNGGAPFITDQTEVTSPISGLPVFIQIPQFFIGSASPGAKFDCTVTATVVNGGVTQIGGDGHITQIPNGPAQMGIAIMGATGLQFNVLSSSTTTVSGLSSASLSVEASGTMS